MKKFIFAILAFVLSFSLVACGNNEKEEEQKEMNRVISSLILASETFNSDTELEEKVSGYTITWTLTESEFAELTQVDGKYVLVVHRGSEWSDALTLTATITSLEFADITASKSFEIYIEKESEYTEYDIITVINDKATGTTKVKISGTVTAVFSQGFWVMDSKGDSIYVFTKSSPEGVAVGDEVSVVGGRAIFYSMIEIENPVTEVTKKGNGTFDYSKVATEITLEDFASKNGDNKAEFGKIYKIKGYVADDPSGKYTYAIKSHLTNSSVTFYDSPVDSSVKDAIGAMKGKFVEATVLFWDYHSSNFVRIVSVSSLVETEIPELTDDQKLILAESVVNDVAGDVAGNIALPTSAEGAEGVTISWVSENEEAITSKGERKIFDNETNVAVTLKATITLGEKTKEVSVTVNLVPISEKDILSVEKETLAAGTNALYFIISGKVVAFDTSKGSKNYFYIADNTGVIFVRTQSASKGIELGKSYKLLVSTTVYYNSNKEVTPQLNVITAEEIEEVQVVEPEVVDINVLAEKYTTDSTMTQAVIDKASASSLNGKLVKFVCYISVRTSGNYTNVYLAVENSQTCASAYYQHTSYYQDELKALDGKKVEIVAPVYGYHASYGWRIGTYLSCTVVE